MVFVNCIQHLETFETKWDVYEKKQDKVIYIILVGGRPCWEGGGLLLVGWLSRTVIDVVDE